MNEIRLVSTADEFMVDQAKLDVVIRAVKFAELERDIAADILEPPVSQGMCPASIWRADFVIEAQCFSMIPVCSDREIGLYVSRESFDLAVHQPILIAPKVSLSPKLYMRVPPIRLQPCLSNYYAP